jgi:hypothetical protein
MNVVEINPGSVGTLPHYFSIALPLTIVTAWIIIAFQSKYIFEEKTTFFKRLGWPAYLLIQMIKEKKNGSAHVRQSHPRLEQEYLDGLPD